MSFESPKLERKAESEKEARIKEIEKEVEETADKLGMPIDERIKDTVTAFNIWEFPTSQSCEGHLHKEGASFPWIEVYASEPKIEDKETKEKEWIAENLKQRKKMIELLEEFYKNRETTFDARLDFSNIGAFGAFRIQSMGAEVMQLFSPEEQKKKIELYRKEMSDLTKFLRDKFLEGKQ